MDLEITNHNMDSLKKFAADVKEYIVKNKLYVEIQGRNYVYVEGWQFLGGMLGITAVPVQLDNQSTDDNIKYACVVELRKGETLVGRGFALCSNAENKKKSFDEYAIASMAQTRAVGKAYRLNIGWLMKLSGYEGTPAEEMTTVDGEVTNEAVKETINAHKERYGNKNS